MLPLFLNKKKKEKEKMYYSQQSAVLHVLPLLLSGF